MRLLSEVRLTGTSRTPVWRHKTWRETRRRPFGAEIRGAKPAPTAGTCACGRVSCRDSEALTLRLELPPDAGLAARVGAIKR